MSFNKFLCIGIISLFFLTNFSSTTKAIEWKNIQKNGYSFATGALIGTLIGATQAATECNRLETITINQFNYGTLSGNILGLGGSLAATKTLFADNDKENKFNKSLLYLGSLVGAKLGHYLMNYFYYKIGSIYVSHPLKVSPYPN